MKTLILILFALTIFISCSKDVSTEIDTSNLKFTKYDQILKLVNLDLFKNNSKVIFKNELGLEKILSINLSELTQNQNVNGQNIVLPKTDIIYFDANDKNYALYFYITSNILNNKGEHNAYLTASIFSNLAEYTPLISFNHLGNPFICTFSDNKLLLGTTFDCVYSSNSSTEYKIFSEIHFSKSFGIVGFRNHNDELWVFDRFEK